MNTYFFYFCLLPVVEYRQPLWLSWIMWEGQKLSLFSFFWPHCIYLPLPYPKQKTLCKFVQNSRLIESVILTLYKQ